MYLLNKIHNIYVQSFVVWSLLTISLYAATHLAVKIENIKYWLIIIGSISVSLANVGMEELSRIASSITLYRICPYVQLTFVTIGGAILLNLGRTNRLSLIKSIFFAAIIPPLALYLIQEYGGTSVYRGPGEWIEYCLTFGLLIGAVLGISITSSFLKDEEEMTLKKDAVGKNNETQTN
jgi:hypothetical protein